ncbi:MAG TPA: DoxX family protein [Oceanipulchritudo sp.]|nr:DoxX family protein [Oceanipulchritudo sp.]
MTIRIALGLIMIGHGAQKLFGWFGGYGLSGTGQFFAESLGMKPGVLMAALAGGGEFFGGLLVLVGLMTRPGAALIGFTMLVAIVKVHGGSFFLPTGMEYVLALLAMSVSLVISGGGKLSIDGLLGKGK